jgi:putative hydrolase of HD superfamily
VASSVGVILRLLDQANHLKRLPRTGWLLADVAGPESVAEHTCAMTLLALALAESINGDWPGHGLAAPLEVGRIARMALVHDLAEALVTDLPKRTTELLGSQVKHAAELAAVTAMTADLPGGADLVQLWAEYDGAATPEAQLVRDADKLEMVHQALCYERRGQRNLDEFWQGHAWHYALSRDAFSALVAARPAVLAR